MPAYCLFENLDITDPAAFEHYKANVGRVVERFGGRYLSVAGKTDVVEGGWRPKFLVLIEFPSLAQAHAWYDSVEYRELKAQRLASSAFNAVFMEGL